jgi:hypothetical protein
MMGYVEGCSGEVLRILERPSENRLKMWRNGDMFWVAVEELDMHVLEPVQCAASAENVPAFR